MRDKKRVRGVKMFVTRIDDPIWLGKEAKRMSGELLKKEHRGPGDTIEAAAGRLQTRLRVPASILLQCWNRPAREMLVSRWMTLFRAHWEEFGAMADAAYEEERKNHDANSALVGLADFVAGRKAEEREVK